ncbi:hypothetical protein QFC22_000869 [Naganishia vaughanmartiniae]|uniref:Uncharacterized protein n=1 Tax=Naganishia vaughanmartiniae TaxID=1424756 RepID=A0ACC2XJ72_9TREE|nr:hypothetical protein QFC22_000869 [Naganishia vaughanmartiniae]
MFAIIALHVLLYLIDGFPLLLILFSITAHIIYLQNFTSQWPFISLTSARFLLSCCMVVADHFLWFFYFAEKAQEAKRYNNSSKRFQKVSVSGRPRERAVTPAMDSPSFMDVAAFFAVCVWFVPLFLFLSLSANDNVLPRMGKSVKPVVTVLVLMQLVTDQIPGTPSGLGETVDLTQTPGGQRTLGKIDTMGTHDYFAGAGTAPARRSLLKSVLSPVLSLLPGRRTGSSRQNAEGIIAPRTPLRGSPMPSPRLGPVPMSRQPSFSNAAWNDDVSPATGSAYGTPANSGPGSPGLSARHAHHFLNGHSPRASSLNIPESNVSGGLSAPSPSTINQRRGSPTPRLGLSFPQPGTPNGGSAPMRSPGLAGYGKPPSFPVIQGHSSPAPPKRTASDAQISSRNSINPRKAVASTFGSGVSMARSTSSALETEEPESFSPPGGAGSMTSDSGVALGAAVGSGVQHGVAGSLTRRVGAAEVRVKDD